MKKHLVKLACLFLIVACTPILEAKSQPSQSTIPFVKGGISHIKQRHWHNASSGHSTSHFNKSMTVSKLNAPIRVYQRS